MQMSTVDNLINDLPKGPLDVYRKCATFHWKCLKFNLEGEDCLRFQNKIWEIIKTNPAFKMSSKVTGLDELRRNCNAQMKALCENAINVISNITITRNKLYLSDT